MRHIPHRRYEPASEGRPRGSLRSTDAAGTARRVKTLALASAGAFIAAVAGGVHWGVVGFVGGALLGGGIVYALVRMVSEGAGAVVGRLHAPSGASTPGAREYSEPQALAQRGLFQEAIDCYATYVVEYPDDPEPCMGIARIYRDHLKRYDDAVRWFRRARGASGIDRGREILVSREIIELYTDKLNTPGAAIPELARLADRFAGSREGELAREELAWLRAAAGAPSS